MGWVCDERPHAVINTLKQVLRWRSTKWWQSTKAAEMKKTRTTTQGGNTHVGLAQPWVCLGQKCLLNGPEMKIGLAKEQDTRQWKTSLSVAECQTFDDAQDKMGRKTKKKVKTKYQECCARGQQPSIFVKMARQCSCVETVRLRGSGSTTRKLWDRDTEGEMGHIRKTLYSWWKRKIALPISKIDDDVKHIFREQSHEADHWANLGAEGQRKNHY